MALHLFSDAACMAQISENTNAAPLVMRLNGTTGAPVNAQVWIKNNDSTKTYKNLQVSALGDKPATAPDLKFCTTENGTYQDTLPLGDGAYTTAGTFWVQANTDASTPSQNVSTIKIQVQAEEEAV